ncbi:hexokinase type 2-like [Oppia nitens]|uniref:hexokinase type 2-like n=1 Tax=Oppia nitens TaxID=1686743 RepID=UPI0023DCA132|nr:hexokinase type 2-like [Oppia nitens]
MKDKPQIDDKLIAAANELTKCFVLSDDKLRQLMEKLEQEFQLGLCNEESATLKMLITYVRHLPNGKERGQYLALDLGGTNFRVILINLNIANAPMVSQKFVIPDELMAVDGERLFDFIADCIIEFTNNHKLETIRIALGFTFSFPCVQYGLCQSKLVRWTKGFNCSGVVGKDVVKLLKNSLKKKTQFNNAFVDIVALINDTTGTLMSCAHKNPNCNIGLIVGTGTNACYIEQLDRIDKWPSNYSDPKTVVINTEWGAFGDNGVVDKLGVMTKWDKLVDADTVNPGRQLYEKMVSGMYLGELVRRLLITLCEQKLLFNGQTPENLLKKGSFPTKSVSKIDSDSESNKFQATRRLFDRDFTKTYTETDLRIIHMANNRVSKRAADLVAVGCSTLIEHMANQSNTIAYDGSVIKLHPHFHQWVSDGICKLIDKKKRFEMMLSEDGSGRGAAIVAAVSYREKRPRIIIRDRKVYEIGTYIH